MNNGRWSNNEGLMNVSCSEVFNVTDNSPTENEDILDAIQQESDSTGVDKRFILAIIVRASLDSTRKRITELTTSTTDARVNGMCSGPDDRITWPESTESRSHADTQRCGIVRESWECHDPVWTGDDQFNDKGWGFWH